MKALQRFLIALVGNPRLDPLSARLFNSVSLVNGVLNLFGAFTSLTLPDPMRLFLLHFISGSLFLLYYYISRFRSRHPSLFWFFNLSLLAFLSFNWFWNGGSVGGAHYYFIPALVIATILLDGRKPYLIYSVSLATVAALFLTEYFHPEYITMYPSREERVLDAGSNYLFVQLLTGILIFILSRNLEFERLKSDRLLRNILPDVVAEELKMRDRVTPRGYACATVLFADMTGFTRASANMKPADLIQELDQIFAAFDGAVRATGLEKIKTIGDAYMAAGGIPEENHTHPVDAVLCALRFHRLMQRHAAKSEAARGWSLRVGVHCGPVITGVVGTDKFVYDVWGDTVNTASRMESSGVPGQVNISRDLYDQVKPGFAELSQYAQSKGIEVVVFDLTGDATAARAREKARELGILDAFDAHSQGTGFALLIDRDSGKVVQRLESGSANLFFFDSWFSEDADTAFEKNRLKIDAAVSR